MMLILVSCDAAKDLIDNEGEDENPPQAASHLDATLEDDGSIGITWQDNSDNEDGFLIEEKIDNGSWSEIADLARNRTSYSYDDVVENTSIRFRVIAYNANGDSNPVDSDPIVTLFNPPTNLSASTTETSIILSWEDNSEVEDGYRIYRKQVGENWVELDDTDGDVVTFTNSGDLELNVSYNYKIAAFQGNILSEYSNEVTAQIGATELLVAPSELTAEEFSDNSIILEWSDNSNGEEGFRIQRKMEGSSAWIDLDDTVSANEDSFIDNDDITEGVRYYYRVFAFEGQRVSDYSNEASAVVGGSGEYTPDAPEDLFANVLDGVIVELSWDDESDNEDRFVIQRKYGDGAFEDEAEVGAGVEEWMIEGLQSGQHFFRVRAENEFGQSDYSNTASATIGGGGDVPNAPSALNVEMNGDHLSIDWRSNSEDESGFRLYRKIGEEGEFTLRETLDRGITVFNDWWALVPNQRHYYKVTAYNENGESNPSNTAWVIYEVEADINAPSNLRYELEGEGGHYEVQLYWNDNSDNEDEFVIERAMEEGQFQEIARPVEDSDEFTDYNVVSNRSYRYRIFARNESASSDYSNVIEVYIEEGGSVPQAPTGLSATVGSGAINLSWYDNSENEEGFNVERRVGSTGSFEYIGETAPNSPDYDDEEVQNGQTYYYRVNAYNNDGTSDYSNTVQMTYSTVSFDTVFTTSFEGYDLYQAPPEWDGWHASEYSPPVSYINVDDQRPRSGSNDLQFVQMGENSVNLWRNFDSIPTGKIDLYQYFTVYSNLELEILADGMDAPSWKLKVIFLDNGAVAFTNGTEIQYSEVNYPFNSWSHLTIRWSSDNTFSIELDGQWVVETSNMNTADTRPVGCIKFVLPSGSQTNHVLDDLSVLIRSE